MFLSSTWYYELLWTSCQHVCCRNNPPYNNAIFLSLSLSRGKAVVGTPLVTSRHLLPVRSSVALSVWDVMKVKPVHFRVLFSHFFLRLPLSVQSCRIGFAGPINVSKLPSQLRHAINKMAAWRRALRRIFGWNVGFRSLWQKPKLKCQICAVMFAHIAVVMHFTYLTVTNIVAKAKVSRIISIVT